MFWIKTEDNRLINLDKMEAIFVVHRVAEKKPFCVRAFINEGYATLYSFFDEKEAHDYVDRLFLQLRTLKMGTLI